MARIKYYNDETASWEYADTGVGIDDSKFSSTTTYSSYKIEEELSELNEANEALDRRISALEQGIDSGGGGSGGSNSGGESEVIVENMRNVVGSQAYNVVGSIGGEDYVLNPDGFTYTGQDSVKFKDCKNGDTDYFIIFFGQEVSGGTLRIDLENSIITKLNGGMWLTNKPITPKFGETVVYEFDQIAFPSQYSGTSGDVTITQYKVTDSPGWSNFNVEGSINVEIPTGFYPTVFFRRVNSVIDDETITSNATFSQYLYNNLNITHESTVMQVAFAELSIDDDYAQDYGVSTLALVTDESQTTKVNIDKAYAAVIEEAKNAWLTEANGNVNKIPLIIHTDQHDRTNKAMWDFISEITDWYDVGKVINLGDTVNSYGGDLLADTKLEAYVASMKSVPYSKRIEIFGNHDTWTSDGSGTVGLTPQNYLYKYFRNIYARMIDNYGNMVIHDDNYNVKYVVVSGFAYDSTKGGYSHYIIPSDSIDWIISELEKVDGYDVIILSHVPLSNVNHKSLNDLWSSRKAKTSGTVTDEYGIAHEFDFTNCDGELLCGLHGHSHEDNHEYIGGLLDVWFDAYYISPKAFHFVIVDRENRRLNVWKVEDTPQYQNYQVPFDDPGA